MAQKMTKKERREAARRARAEAQRKASKQRMMRRLYALLAILAVVALVVFMVTRSQQSNQEAIAALSAKATAAGCSPLQSPPEEGRNHVNPPAQVTYKTSPPTSGNHYGSVGPTGVMPQPVEEEFVVHNMEHGHVVFWHKPDAPQPVVAAVDEVVTRQQTRRISVTNATMETPIAFTAWGRLVTCPATTQAAQAADLFNEFARRFAGKGPEGDIPGQPIGG